MEKGDACVNLTILSEPESNKIILPHCYLPHMVMSKLKLYVDQPVQVTHQNHAFINNVWPLQGVHGNFIQFSKVVSLETESSETGECSSTCLPLCNILPLLHRNCTSVTVEVIFVKLSDIFLYRNKLDSEELQEYVANILRNMHVKKSCIANCQSMKLAKLYGIHKINILSADPDTGPSKTCLKITSNTKVTVIRIISKERYEQLNNKRKTSQIGGMDKIINMVKDIVTLPFKYGEHIKSLGTDLPTGILLQGPPGCGKTSLVRMLAADCEACIVTINGPEVFGSRPGESEENIRLKFEEAKLLSKEGPCILFIDELDSLCPKKSKTGSVHERRLIGQLVAMLDSRQYNENLVVTAATNRASAIDSVLRRPGRFDKEIFIGVPTLEQRLDILKCLTRRLDLDPGLTLESLAEMIPGYVGADLTSLCQEAALTQIRTHAACITMEIFREALSSILPSTQRGSDILVDYRPVQWEDIGGLEDVKVQIKQSIEWPLKHPESFSRLGIKPPAGVLLYGPPGCCKTTLVRAAATSCHVTFLAISGAQLFSPYVGDSEKILTEAFNQARAGAPCILFIDEIDSIVGRREASSKGQEVQERVLSTLLNEMDGVGVRLDDLTHRSGEKIAEGMTCRCSTTVKPVAQSGPASNRHGVLVVAATNRPDMLDDALMRPGRFDRIIYVPPPNQKARHEILKVHTKNMPLKEVDLELLADMTELFSGADLENMCKEAALHALTIEGLQTESVTQEHFIKVLNDLTPSLSEKQLNSYTCTKNKVKL